MKRFIVLLMGMLLMPIIARAQDTVRVEARVDNATPYVGQPVLYTWQWYMPVNDASVYETAQTSLPDFNGFGQQPLTPDTTPPELINGQPVLTRVIRLDPLQAGAMTIAPLRVFAPETPFQPATVLDTQPISINVLPLPPNAPESFENGIGQFDIRAELSAASVTAGLPVTLTLTITGSGNTDRLLTPDLPLDAIWRVYANPPKFVQDTPQVGRQIFTWTLIPVQAGAQTIPPIPLSFFNPLAAQYTTISSEPLTLDVQPGNITPEAVVSPVPTAVPIVSAPVFKPLPATLAQGDAMPGVLFWLVWLIPPGIAGLVWMRGSRRPEVVQPKIVSGSRALQQAQTQIKNVASLAPGEAFDRTGAVILAYVSAKAGKKLNRDNLLEAIQALPAPLQKGLARMLEQAEGGKYAPVTKADAADLIKTTLNLLAQVDKQWKKS